MKRIIPIIFILLLAFTFSTCHKTKIPKDIPKWLKEKIEVMEKDSQGKGCKYYSCRTVEEKTDGSSTFYWINSNGASPTGYFIYNYDGVEQCSYSAISSDLCHSRFNSNKLVRLVWQE